MLAATVATVPGFFFSMTRLDLGVVMLLREPRQVLPRANFSYQDKTWAEFSTLVAAVCMPCSYIT